MSNFLEILFKGQQQARPTTVLRPAYKNQCLNVLRIWRNKHYKDFGAERLIRLFLAISQFLFPGLLVRHISGYYGLLARKLAVEFYVVLKFLLPIVLFKLDIIHNGWFTFLICYLLTETVLYLASLIYLSNEFSEPISYRRSLTYLFLNFIEIVLDFAIIHSYFNYHCADYLNKKFVIDTQAIYFSFVTSATVGYGDFYPTSELAQRIVVLQIIIFFIFVGLFLNFFAARIQDPTYYNTKKKKGSR